MIVLWLHQLPGYVQFILSLVMLDWLFFQCWYAQHVLLNRLNREDEAA